MSKTDAKTDAEPAADVSHARVAVTYSSAGAKPETEHRAFAWIFISLGLALVIGSFLLSESVDVRVPIPGTYGLTEAQEVVNLGKVATNVKLTIVGTGLFVSGLVILAKTSIIRHLIKAKSEG